MSVSHSAAPAPERPDVSVIIPCYNEAAAIGTTVRNVQAACEAAGYRADVLVIDNGSTDDSADRARAAGARVATQIIPGYGAACLRGIELATADILVFVDGDGTYDVQALHRFVEPLLAGYELVLGTRRNGLIHHGAMGPLHRHVLEPVQTWMLRRCFGAELSDVRCGLRAITRPALDRLRLSATGMEFASDMVMEAARAGLATMEVPVEFQPRLDGEPRRAVADGWRVLRQMLLLSPSQLFVRPGTILLALGLLIELVLLPGRLTITPTLWFDYHHMFVGSTLAIVGYQLLLLGIFAKTYALVQAPAYADAWIRRFHARYSLERGVALGGVIGGAGFVINVGILTQWLLASRAEIFAVRPALFAMTLMALGAETIFASFFLSLLRSSAYGRV